MPPPDHIPPDPQVVAQEAAGPEAARADGQAEASPAPEGRPRSTARRVLRGALLALGGLLGLLLLIVLGVLVALQTNWGAARAGDALIALANPFDATTIEVGRIDGNWIGHLALYDLNVTRDDTVRMAHADTLRLRYDLLALLRKKIHVREIHAAGLTVAMRQQADSTWDLLDALGPSSPDTTRSAFVLQIDRIGLDRGAFSAAFYAPGRDSTLRIRGLHTQIDSLVIGPATTLALSALQARVTPPGRDEALDLLARARLAGGRLALDTLRLDAPGSHLAAYGALRLPDAAQDQVHDIDFTLRAAPLAFADVAPFVPALAPGGSAAFEVRLRGSAGLLDALAEARFSDGATLRLEAEATPGATDSVAYRLDGTLRGLNPAFFTGDPAMRGRINADVRADLRGPTLDRLGGTARALVFDTRYADYAFDRTTLGLAFDDGLAQIGLETGLRGAALVLNGTARPFDAVPSYDLRGRLRSLDVGRFAEDSTQSSDLNGAFRVEGQGFDPQAARLTATLDLAASRFNRQRLEDGNLTARLREGTLDVQTRLRFAEGEVAAEAEVRLGDVLRFRLHEGRFENLNVAALLGDTTRSALTGAFALRGSGTDPAADLRLDDLRLSLDNSVYGTYRIHAASLNGALRAGRLDVQADARLDGGTFDLAATARPFDRVPTFAVTRGGFAHVDLGRLTQNPDQSSDLNGSIVELTGRGFDPQTMTLTATLDLAASRLNRQPIDGAQLTLGLRRGVLTFDARLDTPQGSTRLAGGGDLFGETPSFALQTGTVAGLNLGALLGIEGLETELNGTFTAFDLRGADPQTMTLQAHLDLDRSRLNDAVILGGTAEVDLAGGDARAGADLRFERGGARFNAAGRFFDERPTYQVFGTMDSVDVARLAGLDTLRVDLSADFGVEGAGFDPATMTLQSRIDVTDARYDSVRVGAAQARFRLDEGLLRVDTLDVRSNVARLAGGGPVALFDSLGRHASAFRFEADLLDAGPLRALVGAEVFLVRGGHVEGRLFGDPGTRRFEATGALNSMVYDDVRLSSFDLAASGALGRDGTLAAAQLFAEMNYFSVPTLTLRYSEFEMTMEGDSADFNATFTIDQRRDARLRGTVDLNPERRRLTLDDLTLRLDDDRWQLLLPATVSYGDAYRVSNLLIYGGDQQIAMDGVIDPDGTQSLGLTIEQFRIGAIADLFNFPGLDGTLNGSLDLTGPAAAPVLKGRLDLDVESLKEPVGTLRTEVRYDSLRLNLDAVLTHVDGSTLALRGSLPTDLRLSRGADADRALQISRRPADPADNVSLNLDADRFSINWVLPFLDRATVDKIEGQLDARVHVGGTLEDPDLSGTVTLEGGRLGLPELGTTYAGIRGRATLADDQVRLEEAEMRAGAGRATARGTIDLAQLTLGQFDIAIEADDFRAIDSPDYRAVADADLTLRGTTNAPVLQGTVRLISADVYLTEETAAEDFEPVKLTERDLEMLEEYFGIRPTEADTTTFDFYAALDMDLKVRMNRDVWLRSRKNPDMNIQFTGELDLQKRPQQDQQLFGTIEVIPARSYINQFGRRFIISETPREGITNTLTFNGPATDPVLSLQADYEVRSRSSQGTEIIITLALTGRLDDLKLELASDPQTDMTNIVSYLATGRPADEAFQLGGAGSGGALGTGAELAIGQLANIVENAAGSELGLDVIEIQQEGLQGATITAGKYLSRRFYASVSWPISFANTVQENAAGSRRFTIEYELFNWLLARIVSDGATIRLNLLYEYAY